MGKYSPHMLLASILITVIPSLLSQSPNHMWVFENAGDIDDIQDEVTKAKVDARNDEGSGTRYFTSWTTRRKYLSFRGKNLKINLGSFPECISNITNCKNGFTLSLWLLHRSTVDPQYLLGSYKRNGTEEVEGISLLSKNGRLHFVVASRGNLHAFSYKSTAQQWNLHTFVWDGNKASVFVNGRVITTTTRATFSPKAKGVGDLTLGGNDTPNDADFNDVKIWHRQLTSEEIRDNYKGFIEDLVLKGTCQSTTSSICVQVNIRNDYYKLIVTETLFYKDKRDGTVQKQDISYRRQQMCVKNLEPVVTYELYVATVYTDGSKVKSNNVTCKTRDGVPNPPAMLTVKVKSSSELFVSWKKPSPANGLITNYRLDLFESGASGKQQYELPVSKNSFTLNGLTPRRTYTVSMSSISKEGQGKTTEATAVLFGEEMVSNIKVDSILHDKLTVSWDRPSKPDVFVPKTHRVVYKPYGAASSSVETNGTVVNIIDLHPLTYYSLNVFALVRGKAKKLLKKDVVVKTKGKNECDDPYRCGPLANCTDTEKSFICTCPTDFAGDGRVCHRIPSFALATHFCPAENYRNLEWKKYYGGFVAKLPCPDGVYGYATRRCIVPTLHSIARYDAPDLSRCVTNSIREVESQVLQMLDGTKSILDVCNRIIDEIQSTELYGGDILAVISYAKQILSNTFSSLDATAVKVIGNKFTLMASLLMDGRAELAWYDIPQDKRKKAAESLLSVLEDAAVQVIGGINENVFKSAENNTVIEIQKTSNGLSSMTYEDSSNNGYMIQIPQNDVALSGVKTPLLFSKYKNIGTYLKEPKGNVSVSPSLMSATFIGKKMKFQSPVIIRVPHPKGFEVTNPSCVFWNSSSKNGVGAWSSDGCVVHNSTANYTLCYCYHLTNFAVLMTLTPAGLLNIMTGPTAYSLKIITYIGLIISIIALLIALLTFVLFRFLRSKRIICHTHLALSLLLASITFLAGIERTANKNVCQAVAVLLEYFYLVAFFWMAVEGLLLYFMIKKIFKEVKLFKKGAFHLTIWILPVIYVMVMFAIFPQHYGTPSHCWLSTSGGFIWTFILPVLLVILFNTCMMIMALCTMAKRTTEKEESSSRKMWYWLKGTFILMCILGVTWVFGLLHLDSNSVAFAYVFAVLNAFQGVFIFIFHCLIDEKVRNEYKRILTCQPRAEFNEKYNSSNSTRYHKISTSVTSTPNTGTLRNMPSTGSQKEELPYSGDDKVPDSPVFTYSKESPVRRYSNEESDIEKGSSSSPSSLKRSPGYARYGSEENIEIDEVMMVESVPECRDSTPEEFMYEELARKKDKKKMKKSSDSVPANSVEELLKLFDKNDNGTVVKVPEEEQLHYIHGAQYRESLLYEQVIIPETESSPWRSSLFENEDDKKRESSDLRQFYRELSETKDETLVDVYTSNEILTPKFESKEEINEVCEEEVFASNEAEELESVPNYESEVDESMILNIQNKRKLTVNVDDNNVLTLDIGDNNVLAVNVESPSLRSDDDSGGSKVSLFVDDETEILVDHTSGIGISPALSRKYNDDDGIFGYDDDELEREIDEIQGLTDSLVEQFDGDRSSGSETDMPTKNDKEVEVDFCVDPKSPVVVAGEDDSQSPEPDSPKVATPILPAPSPFKNVPLFKFDINVSFTPAPAATPDSPKEDVKTDEIEESEPPLDDEETKDDEAAREESVDDAPQDSTADAQDDEKSASEDTESTADPPAVDNRMSIPSKIMNDIGDIMADIPPKMEQSEPSQRRRVKSKFRTKPKPPLSFSSSMDSTTSNSNTDSERETEPHRGISDPPKPAHSPDLELFKEVEEAIEKDREDALNKSKTSQNNSRSPASPSPPPSSSSSDPTSPKSPSSPKFRCEMEILQIQPGDSVIGSPTHTVLEDSEEDNTTS